MTADRRKAAVKTRKFTGQAGAAKRLPAGGRSRVHPYQTKPPIRVPPHGSGNFATMTAEEPWQQQQQSYPDLEHQNPLFTQESSIRLTPFGSAIPEHEMAEFSLQEISIRPPLQEADLQPHASTSGFAGSQSLQHLSSFPSRPSMASSNASTAELLGASQAYISLGASPMMDSNGGTPPNPGDPSLARCSGCSPDAPC